MRIVVAAVGRLKKGPETELSERYLKRASQTGRQLGLHDIEIIEIRESRAGDPNKRMLEESIALANVIPKDASVVLLDSRGQNVDSAALATQLAKWRANGRTADCFPHRRRRRIGGEPAREGRISPVVRFGHMAASTGARHVAGAALPRHDDTDRASVSSCVNLPAARLATPISSQSAPIGCPENGLAVPTCGRIVKSMICFGGFGRSRSARRAHRGAWSCIADGPGLHGAGAGAPAPARAERQHGKARHAQAARR